MTRLEKAARALSKLLAMDGITLSDGAAEDAVNDVLLDFRHDAPPAVQAWIDGILSEGGEDAG